MALTGTTFVSLLSGLFEQSAEWQRKLPLYKIDVSTKSSVIYASISVKHSLLIETSLLDRYTVVKTNLILKEGGSSLKVKLSVSQEHYEEIKAALLEHGIETDENADLVLSESSRYIDHLIVKDLKTAERVCLSVNEIISIEAFGHSVEVYIQDRSYQSKERLYKIENLLDPNKFLRVSNSVIIARDKIKKISPTLSMKFILTMNDGRDIVVTRSYYYIFRESFDI